MHASRAAGSGMYFELPPILNCTDNEKRAMNGLRFVLIPVILLSFFFMPSARLEAEESLERQPFVNVPEPHPKIAPDINSSVIEKTPADPFGNVVDTPVQSPDQVREESKFRLFPEGLSSALSGKPQEKIPENPAAASEKLRPGAFGNVPMSRDTSPFGNVPRGLKSSPFGNVPKDNPYRP